MYNRYKYYSAIKTGFKHMHVTEGDNEFLRPPTHVIDEQLFLFHIPFTEMP